MGLLPAVYYGGVEAASVRSSLLPSAKLRSCTPRSWFSHKSTGGGGAWIETCTSVGFSAWELASGWRSSLAKRWGHHALGLTFSRSSAVVHDGVHAFGRGH